MGKGSIQSLHSVCGKIDDRSGVVRGDYIRRLGFALKERYVCDTGAIYPLLSAIGIAPGGIDALSCKGKVEAGRRRSLGVGVG